MRNLGKALALYVPILRPFLCTATTFDLHSNRKNRFSFEMLRDCLSRNKRVTIGQGRKEREERERTGFNLILLPQVRLHYEYYKLISLALLLSFKDEVSQVTQVTQKRRVLRIRSSDGPYQKLGNDRMQFSISYSLFLSVFLYSLTFSSFSLTSAPSLSPLSSSLSLSVSRLLARSLLFSAVAIRG